jgi:uncharacterized YccA/Bax inhibitor family protein
MVLWWLVGKVVGVVLLLLGVFLVIFFPWITKHQPESFGKSGILLGLIFLVIGLFLLFS